MHSLNTVFISLVAPLRFNTQPLKNIFAFQNLSVLFLPFRTGFQTLHPEASAFLMCWRVANRWSTIPFIPKMPHTITAWYSVTEAIAWVNHIWCCVLWLTEVKINNVCCHCWDLGGFETEKVYGRFSVTLICVCLPNALLWLVSLFLWQPPFDTSNV